MRLCGGPQDASGGSGEGKPRANSAKSTVYLSKTLILLIFF
jgi:hypothetical protein